jgi:hypothetical protein
MASFEVTISAFDWKSDEKMRNLSQDPGLYLNLGPDK